MRLAGAIGAVRLVVRGFVGSPFVGHGFAVRGFAVRGSWVCCSWVRATRCSWVQRSHRWCDDLHFSGFAISLSLSVCACESFLSLFLSLRDSENDLKVKFWLKIFSESEALILRSAKILFRKIYFPYETKHPHLRKRFSGSDLKPKQTQPWKHITKPQQPKVEF